LFDWRKTRLLGALGTFISLAAIPLAIANSLELLQKGKELQSNNDYRKAQQCYFDGLKIEPGNLSLQDALVETCQAQLQASGASPNALIDLGNALACSGRMDEAQHQFSKAIQSSPNHQNPEASRLLQLAYMPYFRVKSAASWLKVQQLKSELACPTCGSSEHLIPVIIGKPDAVQSAKIQSGKAYLAIAKIQPENLPQWYCLTCRKQFASAGERHAHGDVDFGPYMADLQRRIKRAWFPPKGHESDRVVLSFTVARNGQMSNLKLEKSSGAEIADQEALKAVQNTAPFRKLPDAADDTISIEFTFDYNVFTGGGGGAFRRF
jgi:TonB family protein